MCIYDKDTLTDMYEGRTEKGGSLQEGWLVLESALARPGHVEGRPCVAGLELEA